MEPKKHGLKIYDEKGVPALEIGPHVVAELHGFGAAIGAVASVWAQVEVNLYCLLAVLMDTTPTQAQSALKKYGIAKTATDEARGIAAENLIGRELQLVNEALSSLDAVRPLRNRVQHDTWGRKSTDRSRLYRIHRDQYLSFALKLLDVQQLRGTPNESEAIRNAMSFLDEISDGYSVAELEKIAGDIDAVSKLLLEAMFVIRIRQLNASS